MSIEFNLEEKVKCKACEKELNDKEEALHIMGTNVYYCLRDECRENRDELGPRNKLTIVRGVIDYKN